MLFPVQLLGLDLQKTQNRRRHLTHLELSISAQTDCVLGGRAPPLEERNFVTAAKYRGVAGDIVVVADLLAVIRKIQQFDALVEFLGCVVRRFDDIRQYLPGLRQRWVKVQQLRPLD